MTTKQKSINIRCITSGDILDEEACLACALANPPCGFDYSLMRAILDNEREGRPTIHVTDLVGCLRRAYYSKTLEISISPPDKMYVFLGKAVHTALEADNDLFSSEVFIDYPGLEGRADTLYHDGRLLDIKTTRWMVPNKLPKADHCIQVNMYAYMLQRKGMEVIKLQIQYIDFSGPTRCRKCRVMLRLIDGVHRCPTCGAFPKNAHNGALLCDVPFMSEEHILDYVDTRKEVLQLSLDLRDPPEREEGWLCDYCDHSTICLGGKE
jgi:CRISPR/Cas system-associated exonuclease Cas4 (RecB family)